MTTEQQLRAEIAELRAQRITVPEGWRVSPIEPTDDMEIAAENDYENRGETFPNWKHKWTAMQSAAPMPPTAQPAEPVFMKPMEFDDGRKGWYIHTPEFYADIEPDEQTGAWSVFFRDKDGKEGYAEKATQPQQSTHINPTGGTTS